jgi:hypothetical protein
MESDRHLKKVCPQCDTTVHARRAVVYFEVIGTHALRKTSSKRSMSLLATTQEVAVVGGT